MDKRDLAARVEALSGPDREVDVLIEIACGPDSAKITRIMEGSPLNTIHEIARAADREGQAVFFRVPAYTASLDAAMTLVPEGWDGALYLRTDSHKPEVQLETPEMRLSFTMAEGAAETLPLALCAAALRAAALHTQETSE